MDSKNSFSIDELMRLSEEDSSESDISPDEETVPETETEAEFEFQPHSSSESEDTDADASGENPAGEQSEDEDLTPDEDESLNEGSLNEADEPSDDDDTETDDEDDAPDAPIIADEPVIREARTIHFTRISSSPESDDEGNDTRTTFSAPVSDDTPSSGFSGRNESDDDEVFQNKRQSFSYRSTARTNRRTSRVIRNPEDNIRYVNGENSTAKPKTRPAPEAVQAPKEKIRVPEPQETADDFTDYETDGEQISLAERIRQIPEFFTRLKNELFGIRSISERHQGIELKSVPEMEHFSVESASEQSGDEETEEASGGFRKLFRKSEKNAGSTLDDYNDPSDAATVLEDLRSLKTGLTVKFFIQLAATLLSVYLSASALYHLPMPAVISNTLAPHRYSFAMFIISAAVLFSSFPMVAGGIKNLFRKKADCDSLAAVAITLCTIAAAISTESPEMIESGAVSIFTPAAVTAFLANTLGKRLIADRAIANFEVLIRSHSKYGLVYVDNETRAEQLTRGAVNDYPILAASRKTGFSGNFLKYSYSADAADNLCSRLVPASIFLSVVLTLVSVIVCSRTLNTLNITFITSMLSMFISLCTCFGIPLIVNYPLLLASDEAEENESLILGYQSIDDFYDTNSLIVDASQLFPESSLSLHSIKMYSDAKIDDVLVSAASLVIKSGSIFTGMFRDIIDGNEDLLENAENFFYEDSLGHCGWIRNKRVLFGSRQLMINHNIEGVPPESKDEEITASGLIPLYLSVSGNLAAVFSVKITADSEAADSVYELTDNGISLIIRNRDSAVTEALVSSLFDIPEDMVKIIPDELTGFCDKITAPVQSSSSSVICSEKLSSVAAAISNIRHIHHSSMTGLVLQGTSVVLAVIFAVIFMFIGIIGQISPLIVILYHTVWVFLTLFIMKVKPR